MHDNTLHGPIQLHPQIFAEVLYDLTRKATHTTRGATVIYTDERRTPALVRTTSNNEFRTSGYGAVRQGTRGLTLDTDGSSDMSLLPSFRHVRSIRTAFRTPTVSTVPATVFA